MSPFLVTTRPVADPPNERVAVKAQVLSRRAVATLEEARTKAVSRIAKCAWDAGTTEGYQPFEDAAKAVTESGGSVGPLPDGTTIEVEPVEWASLAIEAGVGHLLEEVNGDMEAFMRLPLGERPRVLAAYNAKQEADRGH